MKNAALFLGLALAGLLFAPAASAAGDAEAGRDKAETCLGCHGIPNYANMYPNYSVPKLGGQHADYIVAALQAYRSGARQHPTMSAQAESLSDQDIQDIAAYFATFKSGGQPEPDRGGDVEAGKEKAATCAACHGLDGNSPNAMYPILTSQYADYLEHALRAYKSGQRNNAIMSSLAAPLTEEDIEDLAAWFASQSGGVTVLDVEMHQSSDGASAD
ncbi:MAG TPA: cytochrome c [Gammaproteobacteria bacterium]